MIFIALGANLPSKHGSPEQTLEAAKAALNERGIKVVKSSRTWVTAPVPVSDQPNYRNAVVAVETDLTPRRLFNELKDIEKEFGRTEAEKNAARVLDLDLLAFQNSIIDTQDLIVPHPRMHTRSFVLQPLYEIAEGWVHPVTGRTLSEMIEGLPITPAKKVREKTA